MEKAKVRVAVSSRLMLISLAIVLVGVAFHSGNGWGLLVAGVIINTWGFVRLTLVRGGNRLTVFLMVTGFFLMGCGIAASHKVPIEAVWKAVPVFFLVELVVLTALLPGRSKSDSGGS